jgi:hypothetical protein
MTTKESVENLTVVRLAGHGQFRVNGTTINKINAIDNQIVNILDEKKGTADEKEFRKKITEMVNLITTEGKPLDDREIVSSDIIIPSTDLSLEEAKKIFKGEGIVPEI